MPNIMKSFLELGGDVVSTQVGDTNIASVSVSEPLNAILDTSVANVASEKIPYAYEKSQPSSSARLLVYDSPCYETFEITDVSQVRSLVLEANAEAYKNKLGVFPALQNKMKARTQILEDIKKLDWAKSNGQKASLEGLLNRWESTKSMLTTLPQHPASIPLMDISEYEQLKNEERGDIDSFSDKKYENMKKVINEFYAAYEALFSFTKKYHEEEEQILRFDAIYNSSEVSNLLNKIPYIFFTATEIKALNMQETADFTNTTVAGLTDKTLGIIPINPHKNPAYIGLGQHNEGAKNEGVDWASKKGITILGTDPRIIPQTSILLTIAYLGMLVENRICKELGGIRLDCLELKKMLFASYNTGPSYVLNAIKSLHKNGDLNITWLKVRDVIEVSGSISDTKLAEMTRYADEIPKRLTQKQP